MVRTKSEVIKVAQQYKALVSELFDGVEVRLFGSFHNGNANAHSDIDLAIVSSDFYGIAYDVAIKLLARLKLKLDRSLEPIPFTPDDLANPKIGSLSFEVARNSELI